MVEAAQFELFVRYVTGNLTKSDLAGVKGVSRSTLARDLDWCWQVPTPSLVATGEIYDQIFLDGIYLNSNWVLLCGVNNRGETIAWQWATSENSLAYKALLKDIPPPKVVTVDGAAGGLKAIGQVWGEETAVQRCLLHIHRNNRADLTFNPKTMAGKSLLGLSRALLKITSQEEASHWEGLLQAFYNQYSGYLKERSYAKDNPEEGIRRGRTWRHPRAGPPRLLPPSPPGPSKRAVHLPRRR